MIDVPFSERLTVPINEALRATGIGRTKLYQLISEGKIEVVKIGTRSLVTTRSLRAVFDPASPQVAA